MDVVGDVGHGQSSDRTAMRLHTVFTEYSV